jgi:hypothetical protein
MDSTITVIQQVLSDTVSLDSINHKLDTMKYLISQQKPSNPYSLWIPFFSAIAGGLLVLGGQFIDRFSKRETETKNNLREIYAYSRKLEALMKNNYRELAMAKTHVEYWWYCHLTADNNSDKQKYYDEHLRSQSFAREIERRIGETKAEFIGHVRKFQAIKRLKPEIEKQLLAISDLTNSKAKTYDTSIPHEQIRYGIVEQDETKLRETYYMNLFHFKSINDYLLDLLNKL